MRKYYFIMRLLLSMLNLYVIWWLHPSGQRREHTVTQKTKEVVRNFRGTKGGSKCRNLSLPFPAAPGIMLWDSIRRPIAINIINLNLVKIKDHINLTEHPVLLEIMLGDPIKRPLGFSMINLNLVKSKDHRSLTDHLAVLERELNPRMARREDQGDSHELIICYWRGRSFEFLSGITLPVASS